MKHKGWIGQSKRHALAAKGIKTKLRKKRSFYNENYLNEQAESEMQSAFDNMEKIPPFKLRFPWGKKEKQEKQDLPKMKREVNEQIRREEKLKVANDKILKTESQIKEIAKENNMTEQEVAQNLQYKGKNYEESLKGNKIYSDSIEAAILENSFAPVHIRNPVEELWSDEEEEDDE